MSKRRKSESQSSILKDQSTRVDHDSLDDAHVRINAPSRPSRWAWRRWLTGAACVLATLALGAALWQVVFGAKTPLSDARSSTVASAELVDEDPGESLLRLSAASQSLSQRVRRAVVRVEAADVQIDAADDELAQLFGEAPPAFGQGSGVIVEADGYLLTNYHVVRGAKDISVVVDGTERLSAQVIGADALTDLALLKVNADGLETITWGDSDALAAGAFVWAVGCPFGLEGSVSFGIVSATNRDTLSGNPFQAFLQTDAAVNPGNSGGPLVDSQGRVVGINTAILGRSFQGISFAIPSNLAQEIHKRLKQDGRVQRGWLGVSLEQITEQRAAQLNVRPRQGVYVVSVAGDAGRPSPAWRAGIRAGDVLMQWNGRAIDDPIQLSRIVAQSKVGSQVEVTVHRNSQEVKFPLIVGERPH